MNSDNTRLRQVPRWEPQVSLEKGVGQTYEWIEDQVKQRLAAPTRSLDSLCVLSVRLC